MQSKMFLLIVHMVGMLLLAAKGENSVRSTEEVACPSCMHLAFELRNIPPIYRRIVEQVFAGLALENPECESNTIEPQTCEAPALPGWMENRCLTTNVVVHAVGITGFLPDAEMDVTVLVRECLAQWTGEDTGCIDFASLDEATREQITQQLAAVRESWDHVTYTGQLCVI